MASTYRQVGYGSTGSAVTKLQTTLNEHGYDLDVDGIFGEKTQAAVRDYQEKYGLKLDGIAGKETWGSLLAQDSGSDGVQGGYPGNVRSSAGSSVCLPVQLVTIPIIAPVPSFRQRRCSALRSAD